MPSDRMRDEDPRVQSPRRANDEVEETGRAGDDFRGVGEDADELLDDGDFSEPDETDEEDDDVF